MPLTTNGSIRIAPRAFLLAVGVGALGLTVALRASDDAGSKAAVPAERVASYDNYEGDSWLIWFTVHGRSPITKRHGWREPTSSVR